jgi:hypothetical protein
MMKQIKITFLPVFIALLFMTSFAFSKTKLNHTDETERWKLFDEIMGVDEGWKLEDDEKGIKVYTRMTRVSPIKAFKGVTQVKADFQTMVAFLADRNAYPSYVYLCDKVEILKQKSDADVYLHTISKPPWPVNQRDMVSHNLWFYKPEEKIAVMNCIAVPELIPEIDGHVRIPLAFIQVTVKAKENGMVEIVFEGVCQPGGWIPDWVANFCVTTTPFFTLTNIKDKRPFEKFFGKTVSFLQSSSLTKKQKEDSAS